MDETTLKPLIRQFVRDVVRTSALQFGEFLLRSGRTSPFYLDLRTFRSFPSVLLNASRLLWSLVPKNPAPDCIADVPTAATPFVSVIATQYSIPMITPREPKEHGTKGAIDGVFEPGQRVVLLDDLITTAGSKLTAIQTLRDAGLVVEDVCVLIDRGQGGREGLQEVGCSLYAAISGKVLFKLLAETEPPALTREQLKTVLDYLASDEAQHS